MWKSIHKKAGALKTSEVYDKMRESSQRDNMATALKGQLTLLVGAIMTIIVKRVAKIHD